MTPSAIPEPATKKAPRWMWVALVLSVAINLIIVGMVAAALFHFRGGHGGPGKRFGHYVRSLPDDRRQVLAPLFEQQRAAIRPLRRKARQTRREIRDALQAEPYDRERLVAAHAAATKARSALDQARGEWITKFAESMTVQERRDFLSWRGHRRHRRWQ